MYVCPHLLGFTHTYVSSKSFIPMLYNFSASGYAYQTNHLWPCYNYFLCSILSMHVVCCKYLLQEFDTLYSHWVQSTLDYWANNIYSWNKITNYFLLNQGVLIHKKYKQIQCCIWVELFMYVSKYVCIIFYMISLFT